MVAASSTNPVAGDSTMVVPPMVPPPREVARPVSNLGNTCYMNAVLQALAHAPELCLAMDCEPHHVTCPIAMENRKRRISASPSSSPEDQQSENDFRRNNPKHGTAGRKLRRSSRKSPTAGQSANVKEVEKDFSSEDGLKYCALCEMEWHLQEVHNSKEKDKPVAPSFFVHGFIDHVAPWFKLGQQEDSHEFLRLLIDAMQRSCKNARPLTDDAMDEDIPPIGDDLPNSSADEESKDVEYPFQLFRGTVESCVQCESCKAQSSTLDPIEDVGLEVMREETRPVSLATRGGSPPGGPYTLADVTTAFKRFVRIEALDAGYKCEKCGKVGRATKQSQFASIPPILTLHLKRFRYGADGRPSPAPNNSRRAKSGSAKIEGHIHFKEIFDLRPYLTHDLRKQHKAMFCRLFAVIVHAGKNSHSGHYVAYVRSIGCNEWWKMDDARITMASMDEVKNAEAYMLFYRVLDHPVAVKMEERAKKMRQEREQVIAKLAAEAEEEEKAKAKAAETAETEKENLPSGVENKTVDSPAAAKAAPAKTSSTDKIKQEDSPSKSAPGKASSASAATASSNSRKRGLPAYTDGKSWAKANTRLRSSQYSSFRSAEEFISENVQFKQEFFKRLTEEGSKTNAKVDHLPIKRINGDDVVGGNSKYHSGLKSCIHRIAQRYEAENDESFFSLAAATAEAAAKSNLLEKFVAVGAGAGGDELL